MKKFLTLFLSAALLLAMLGGCTNSGAQNTADPTGSPTNSPTQTEQPTPEPAPADLAAFFEALAEAYHFPAMMQISDDPDMQELLDNWYSGLSDISTEQLVICTPAASSVVSEIALVQVANASDVNAVKDILQARIDAQVNGGAWYPASIDGWKNNSRIVSSGNYVMMIANTYCDTIVTDFNAFIADPSYKPTPVPEDEGNGSEDDNPGGGAPSFPDGGIVIPFPGGGTEPDSSESPESDGGAPGFGGVPVPGFGGVAVPGFGGEPESGGGAE